VVNSCVFEVTKDHSSLKPPLVLIWIFIGF
jgi:hypothetical protein